MTQSQARRLVVSYAFAPYVDPAAQHAAKRVRESGVPVDVIHNAMDERRALDPDLDLIVDGLMQRRQAVASPTVFGAWSAVRDFAEEGLATALAWDADGLGYTELYSRANYAHSHVLAARVALRRPLVRWVAEFAEPVSLDANGRRHSAPVEDDELLAELRDALVSRGVRPPESDNLYVWSEVLALGLADEVVFTSEQLRARMLEDVDPELAERVRAASVIREQPAPPADLYTAHDVDHPLDPDRRHIAYFGSLYRNPAVDTTVEALTALPQSVRERLALHLFTRKPREAQRVMDERGVGDVVRCNPPADYLDSLALMRRMDCLLLNDTVTAPESGVTPFVPSMWSDYAGSGASVWGMVQQGSALDAQPLAHTSPVNHVSAACQVLAQIARSDSSRG